MPLATASVMLPVVAPLKLCTESVVPERPPIVTARWEMSRMPPAVTTTDDADRPVVEPATRKPPVMVVVPE